MLKKDITFTNLDNQKVTKTYFFHLSKADLIRMETSVDGGLGDHLAKIVEGGSDRVIMGEFEKLILSSYGVKSEDGNRFIKSDELREEFKQTEAYSELLMELCTDEGAALQFIHGIVPHNLRGDLARMAASGKPKITGQMDAAGVENSMDPQYAEILKEADDDTFEGPESVTNSTFAEQTVPEVKQRVITPTEAAHMDASELQHLIATGQAVFGQ